MLQNPPVWTKGKIFATLMLAVFAVSANAQTVNIRDAADTYAVSYPMYLQDRTGELTFEDIRSNDSLFIKAGLRVPDFLGNLSKAIWYRFNVRNDSDTDQWNLEVKGGYMHKISVYVMNGDRMVTSVQLSADGEFEKRPVKSNDLIFPVIIPVSEERTFYVRATSRNLIRPSMSFSTMQRLYENSTRTSYGNGFLTALAAALLIYNLFVYFSLREKVYLFYIGYILCYILHNNYVSGDALLFFPGAGWLNTSLLLPLLGCFSILFTNSFLQTETYAPVIFKTRYILFSICVVPVVVYFTGNFALAVLTTSTLMFCLFAYWITAGIIAYRNGFQPAIFYIWGFGALITSNMLFYLKIVGVIEENYWIDSALYIGSAMEAVILSFALANKINFYKKEKERIQQQAYEQAVTFSRDLINTQEAERKRIASELHDSVGQKLIVIKNKVLLFLRGEFSQSKQRPENLADNVADVIQEIRSISYGLRPYQMDLLGLTQSVKSLAEEVLDAAEISFTMHVDNIDDRFEKEAQMNIYRIIQECLNNLVKHAHAGHCLIKLAMEDNTLKIHIEDNGRGIDPDAPINGFGLKGIRERLHILNGSMSILPRSPSGTVFTFEIPVNSINNYAKLNDK